MKITYLTTVPRPKVSGTDAIYQEIDLLQQNFGGELQSLFPFKRPNSWVPRFAYGLHNYSSIKRKEKDTDVYHLFTNGLHWFPVISHFNKPKILSIVASVGNVSRRQVQNFSIFDKIIVSNERDRDTLHGLGLTQTSLIRPGINLKHITEESKTIQEDFTLFMASAPWESKQFYSKGIDFLLQVLQQNPRLRLILLWRGILEKELLQRLDKYGIEDQVEFVNERVNVNDYLKKAHASILIANSPNLVKAYPHSLVESISGGKPVIISQAIPMANYVREKGCGVVLEKFNPVDLEQVINNLIQNYDYHSSACGAHLKSDFSVQRFVKNYQQIHLEPTISSIRDLENQQRKPSDSSTVQIPSFLPR